MIHKLKTYNKLARIKLKQISEVQLLVSLTIALSFCSSMFERVRFDANRKEILLTLNIHI